MLLLRSIAFFATSAVLLKANPVSGVEELGSPLAMENKPGSGIRDVNLAARALSNSDFSDDIIKVVCGTNKEREKMKLPPLKIYSVLNEIAQKHSSYQNSNKKTTHDDPGGTLGKRLTGMSVRWSFCAENVAGGFDDTQRVVQAWMNSPGHKANILNNRIKAIGVGRDGKYWTQNFADFSSGFTYDGLVPQC
ncbi:hypothetical protein BB559_004897 [Furculomyces boomerangus]|uniref:SCP domain-containing protein n=2 Tax=Harpellales TaxID=61421 RepID=A0A2T9YBZ8_9FUNG|nr:hypothetical protein BB559_004897 [Furculomyces boomerangus]PWA03233.1 hypothetical protein BB558_000588 [Smittium angustum]